MAIFMASGSKAADGQNLMQAFRRVEGDPEEMKGISEKWIHRSKASGTRSEKDRVACVRVDSIEIEALDARNNRYPCLSMNRDNK
jgi:hypothetical protein